MKTICSVSLRVSLMALMLLPVIMASSQRVVVWKGGTPGLKNDWNCPQNWSPSSVPDEFSNVYIPDVSTSTLSSPVIRSGKVEINCLYIDSNASLKVEKPAQLIINGTTEYLRWENLYLEGTLLLPGSEPELVLNRNLQTKE